MSSGLPRTLVLAAGYGSRLAPITDHVPKPLLPVDGQTLLDGIVARLFRAGAPEVAVNSHHLGGQIGAHLAAHAAAERLVHFPETEILGTGGPLANARDFLSAGDDFLLHNGDVLCDADLGALVAAHRGSGALATLLLADWPAVNSVRCADDGTVLQIAGHGPGGAGRDLTYTGIAVFALEFLDLVPDGPSSLVTALAPAVTEGRVGGWAPGDLAWNDLGTLGRWLDHVGPDTETPGGLALTRLTGHGSDRRFWRLAHGAWSAVAMSSPPGDDEHERFCAVQAFLAAEGLAPADLLARDDRGRAVLMEDLGGESLWSLGQVAPPEEAYAAAVDWLAALQAVTPRAAAACPLAVDRVLDASDLRWETDYFATRFLQGHLGWSEDDIAPLAREFDALAANVAAHPQALLHRDYQSQNLLWSGGRVRPVDYQGMRLGPVTYDLASLLHDPYVDIAPDLRAEWSDRFAAATGLAPAACAAMSVACGLQRVMQALGAYGFLGHIKGRASFLQHIPAGWSRLRGLLDAAEKLRAGADSAAVPWLSPPLPRLRELVAQTTLPDGPNGG